MFTKIDWIRKLTSRKFWTAVASFISMLMIARGSTSEQAERITALIIAGATVVAYIIGEGLTDAASCQGDPQILITDRDEDEEEAEG